MSSRAQILSQIKNSKPDLVPLPILDVDLFKKGLNLKSEFVSLVEAVGGSVFYASSLSSLSKKIAELYPKAKERFSSVALSKKFNTIRPEELWYPHELSSLDVLVLEGAFGVAENGAVWLSEDKIPMRVMPFITKHLILILKEKNLVENMHDAYERIKEDNSGYGLFVSGPSKTADIEQSLVIGAQGAMSLHVVLIPS